ncbi:MAG: twin-arginine translocase TatA/TatE family subunit [Solirubrobacteraceae bacterium]|jgi:TatA/E family protein of Tat protein translocase
MFHNPLADGIVVLIILILFFAPKRLPMLGRGVGEGIKEFKAGISGAASADANGQPQLPEGGDAAQGAGAPSDRSS